MKVTGKMSTFGGPDDTGVAPGEGLALIEPVDLNEWWFNRLFLVNQPPHTTGLARRLNPAAFYLALRFGKRGEPTSVIRREQARRAMFKCSANNKVVWAQGADYGPANWTERVVDVSPGVADQLGLHTDDQITIEMFT